MAFEAVGDSMAVDRNQPIGYASCLSEPMSLTEPQVELIAHDVMKGSDNAPDKLDEFCQETEDECETDLAESTSGSLSLTQRDSEDSVCSDLDLRNAGQPEFALEGDEVEMEADDDTSSQKKKVKLIFLDMDGPVAPYKAGMWHKWRPGDDFGDVAYAANVSELRRIIDMCGGPDVVKVVLSSNWRTDEERMPWLRAQFERCGIDMIGHTDVIHTYPHTGHEMLRNVEIYRMLQSRTVGQDGPYFDKVAETNKFRAWELPADWEITNWITIDDLRLDRVPESHWHQSNFLVGYLPSEEEPEASGSGWYHIRKDFGTSISEWYRDFASDHFVYAEPERGIADTRGAAERAIDLLNKAPLNTHMQ